MKAKTKSILLILFTVFMVILVTDYIFNRQCDDDGSRCTGKKDVLSEIIDSQISEKVRIPLHESHSIHGYHISEYSSYQGTEVRHGNQSSDNQSKYDPCAHYDESDDAVRDDPDRTAPVTASSPRQHNDAPDNIPLRLLDSDNTTVTNRLPDKDNLAEIFRSGAENEVTISQQERDYTYAITQGSVFDDDAHNHACIIQHSDHNMAGIAQTGENNWAEIEQVTGSENISVINQSGSVSGRVNGPALFAEIRQDGYNNTAFSGQTGQNTAMDARINQTGDGNVADIGQYGSDSAGHSAAITQNGYDNHASITQH